MEPTQADVDNLNKALGKERAAHKATRLKLTRSLGSAVANVDRLIELLAEARATKAEAAITCLT